MFKFGDEVLDLLIIQTQNKEIDLSQIESIHSNLKSNFKELEFYKSSKKHSKTRESEIHLTLEQGAELSSKEFWALIQQIVTED